MAWKKITELNADKTIQIGGQGNPTSLEGYYLGHKLVPSTMSSTGNSKLHIFQTSQGNLGVWGKANLDRQLLAIEPGTMTRTTFTGMYKTKTGMRGYGYDVEHDPENKVDVSSLAGSSQGHDSSEDVDSSDDESSEETAYVPPTKPQVAASAPTAAKQNHVKSLLQNSRKVS